MKIFFTCICSVLLVACVIPVRVSMYELSCIPIKNASCAKRNNELLIELPGGASAHLEGRTYGDRASICMYIKLQHGSTFQFASSDVNVEGDITNGAMVTSISKISGSPYDRAYRANEKIDLSSDRRKIADDMKTRDGQQFWIWFESEHRTLCETNIPAVTELTLRMPDIFVNNKKAKIPLISFSKKQRWVAEGLR